MNHTQQPTDQAWQAFVARSGAPLTGVVSSIVPFGSFVRFEEGVDGLLHASETPHTLEVGQQVRVEVLELDSENRRVSLREV